VAQVCLSCGNQLPGQQLMARLNTEAEQIRRIAALQRNAANGHANAAHAPVNTNAPNTNTTNGQEFSTLDRLQEMHRQADAAAQRKNMDQHGRNVRW
jgi:polyhydroxyalkanoate synthesis regulator protein